MKKRNLLNNKKLSLIIGLLLSTSLFGHYPDNLICEPSYRLFCSVNVTSLKNKTGTCRSFDISDRYKFELISQKSEGHNPAYEMKTTWLDYPFVKIDTAVLIDIDRGEIFGQPKERTFMVPKIGGEGGFFDGDISAFATLSSTGHPHTLQFIIPHENTDTITDIFYAFCQET